MKVAVLGLGRMGAAMASSLVAAGHEVSGWNRSPRSLAGVSIAGSVGEAVAGVDLAVVMVLDGPASSAVIDGLVGSAPEGLLVVNMSTIAPSESVELAGRCAEAGLRYVEAPVLGSIPNVEASGLTVLAGGAADDVASAGPVFEVWTRSGRVVHTGELGTATGLKLVANLSLGIAAAGLHDCVALGAALGLSRRAVLDILERGSLGGLVQRKRDRLDADDYSNADFTTSALTKDLALARASAGAPLLMAEAALSLTTTTPPNSDLAALAATPTT